jgi:hypothetical protein
MRKAGDDRWIAKNAGATVELSLLRVHRQRRHQTDDQQNGSGVAHGRNVGRERRQALTKP